MKALVKFASGPGNLDVLEVPEPACPDDGVKLTVAACGICGTDLHVRDDTFRNFPPVILGHEFAGTVVEVGANVRGVSLGTRAAVLGATAVTCGQCAACRSGYFIFCARRRGMGHGVNGAFAPFVVVRPDQLYPLPERYSLEEGALCEPLAAAVQAVAEVTEPRLGETALVSGPGPMGLLCLKLLVAAGIPTIVSGAADDDARLAAARQFGALATINVAREPVVEAVRALTGGVGVDVALECAGHPSSVRACLEALRPMGRYTQVAISGADITFPIDQIFYKQLTLRGSITYTADTWARMMRICARHDLGLRDLITTVLPLSAWREGFGACEAKTALKVILTPSA